MDFRGLKGNLKGSLIGGLKVSILGRTFFLYCKTPAQTLSFLPRNITFSPFSLISHDLK